jgi:CBS domain-containing protein
MPAIQTGRLQFFPEDGGPAMKVNQAMHAGAQWVEPGTPLLELARLMRDHNIGAIPIGENDRLVGMVTDRDIVCRGLATGLDLGKATARDVMSKGIFYCRDSQEIADAAHTMEQNKVRRLPVIDDSKRLVGVLSVGDISRTGERALCGEIVQATAAKAS